MTIKIFDNKSGKLTEIEKIDKKEPWDFEKEIQILVQNNVGIIFRELEFVSDEFTVDELRPDSVCFNKESNCFVIIEYKKLKHGGAIDQAMAYLDLLDENKDKFISLYHEKKKELLDSKYINWEETKVIIISPDFTPHQLRAAKRTTEPIEFWLIERYDDTITLRMLHEKKKQVKKKTEKPRIVTSEEYSEEDYLAGEYFNNTVPNENAKKLFKIMKEKILETFSDLEVKQRSKYAGFYSIKDGSAICTIEVTRNGLKVCYSTTKKDAIPKSEFVRYMRKENGEKTGHWGVGDYMSKIENESEIDKAIPLIEKVYQMKVK